MLSSLIISNASLLIEERPYTKVKKRNFISSSSCGIDIFSKLRGNNEICKNIVHHRPLTEVNMVLFLKNKRFNDALFLSDYRLRW